MQVETFEVCEVDAKGKVVEVENADEVKALIEKLGLDAQRAFVEPNEEGQQQVIPYRKITREESFAYRMLCPESCSLARFGESLIPLRVLQVAAHAKECGMFKELEVWHVSNADVKDPVLIGKAGQYNSEIFLLARWGEALEPLSVLVPKALALWRERTKSKLKEIQAEVEGSLARVETFNPLKLRGGLDLREPHFSGFSW